MRERLAQRKEELQATVELELGEAAVVAAEAALDDEFATREEAPAVHSPTLNLALALALALTLTPTLT